MDVEETNTASTASSSPAPSSPSADSTFIRYGGTGEFAADFRAREPRAALADDLTSGERGAGFVCGDLFTVFNVFFIERGWELIFRRARSNMQMSRPSRLHNT